MSGHCCVALVGGLEPPAHCPHRGSAKGEGGGVIRACGAGGSSTRGWPSRKGCQLPPPAWAKQDQALGARPRLSPRKATSLRLRRLHAKGGEHGPRVGTALWDRKWRAPGAEPRPFRLKDRTPRLPPASPRRPCGARQRGQLLPRAAAPLRVTAAPSVSPSSRTDNNPRPSQSPNCALAPLRTAPPLEAQHSPPLPPRRHPRSHLGGGGLPAGRKRPGPPTCGGRPPGRGRGGRGHSCLPPYSPRRETPNLYSAHANRRAARRPRPRRPRPLAVRRHARAHGRWSPRVAA